MQRHEERVKLWNEEPHLFKKTSNKSHLCESVFDWLHNVTTEKKKKELHLVRFPHDIYDIYGYIRSVMADQKLLSTIYQNSGCYILSSDMGCQKFLVFVKKWKFLQNFYLTFSANVWE